MKINIQSVGFTASSKLLDFTEAKLMKLLRFEEDIESAEVYLKVENSQEDRKEADIRLQLKGGEVFASKQANSFEEAVDDTIEALRRQLLKRKDKGRS